MKPLIPSECTSTSEVRIDGVPAGTFQCTSQEGHKDWHQHRLKSGEVILIWQGADRRFEDISKEQRELLGMIT